MLAGSSRWHRRRKHHEVLAALRGFSLVKFLLAIGAVLLVLAIAVPIYFGSRIATMETAAKDELQNIHQAEHEFRARSGRYAATLAELGADSNAPLTYLFTITRTDAGFTASAAPQPYYGFSRRTIHIDESGAIRYTWSDVQAEEAKP